MKYHLLLLPLALAACSQTPQANGPASSNAANPAAAAANRAVTAAQSKLLDQYHWQLTSAIDSTGKRIGALFVRADKPVELNFTANRLNIVNSCNTMSGGYTLNSGQLQIGPMTHTMMACADPALSALDSAIGQRMLGNLTLNLHANDDTPQLQLVTDKGDTLSFTGKPTDDARYGGPAQTVFLEVAAQTTPCNNALTPDKQCLKVRELHYDDNGLQTGAPGDWHPLNQDIGGYTHEDGVRNVLRLKRYAIRNPPADGPATAYALDMVVATEKVQQ